jgi:multicomponent Na+:H+ antiporter subunit E
MRQLILFLFSFVLWFLLVWPIDAASGQIMTHDVIAGLVLALIVAVVMREVTTRQFVRWLSPVRIFWLVAYFFVLVYYIIKANFDVAYRVLHPAMPIRPGIVKVKTSLTTETAITVLANSITLTPGTLTIEARPDGTMYVHWINIKADDVEGATKHIVQRFEWFIKRIFE